MKDKAWTLGVLLVAVLLVVLLTSAQRSDMGRYQIVVTASSQAWKIDTTTGGTWYCQGFVDPPERETGPFGCFERPNRQDLELPEQQ